LKEYVRRDIISLNQKQYLNKVEEFSSLLEEIKDQMQQLKNLADREDSHPSLADEMRAKIRGCEESLCGLGPEIHFSTVAKSIEFFDERKKHLNRLRGIHLAKTIDFYGE
jgi:vacuolar-type H+-ATPase subunit I/STV1